MDPKIFDTLLEPVFILNREKQILYCNEAAAVSCGITVRKILRSGNTLDELLNFKAKVEHLDQLSEVSESTPYQEIEFSSLSQKIGKAQITFQPFGEIDGQHTWIVFFRDVTLEEILQKKYRAELGLKEEVIRDLKQAQKELEDYSRNLEQMVDNRTLEIRGLNLLMTALLDSLNQGFFVFDREGKCLEVDSKACLTTVETRPAGQKIWNVIRLPEKQIPGFQKWMETAFAEMLPFEDLAALAPQRFAHSQNRDIKLEYYPLRTVEGRIDGIVVVATDITELILAQQDAEKERTHAKMIVSLVQYKRQITNFIQDAELLFAELNRELKNGAEASAETLFRCYHTLKGGASFFTITPMVEQAHECESLLALWSAEKSDELFEKLKAESVKIEEHFQDFLKSNESILGSADKLKQRWVEVRARHLAEFQTKLPASLQIEFVEEFLMEPVGEFFKQYGEVAISVAEREMKELRTPVFLQSHLLVLPEPYLQLFSTFVHAYRNAVDHGIESPFHREELGKPREGNIETSFNKIYEAGRDWLVIKVKDDGSGIDPEKIRARLQSRGIEISAKTDDEIIQHVFDSQFSTKDVVTEVSGRGVGMDAIKNAAIVLGGKAWVESKVGAGTTLIVQVPYLRGMPQVHRSSRAFKRSA